MRLFNTEPGSSILSRAIWTLWKEELERFMMWTKAPAVKAVKHGTRNPQSGEAKRGTTTILMSTADLKTLGPIRAD